MSLVPHKCRCRQCFQEMSETVEHPTGEIFDQLMVLTSVAGHLHRSGEHHSADTIREVQEKVYTGLATAMQKAKEGAVAQLGEHLRGTQEVQGSSPCRSTIISDFLALLRMYEFNAKDCGDRPVIKLSVDDIEKDFLDELKFVDQLPEDGLTGRALELADLVSYIIWGGSRGWERADKEQFEVLKREARKRLTVVKPRLVS